MKRICESPEFEALAVKAEDVITLSYMLPEMSIDTDIIGGDVNDASSYIMK